MHVSLVACLLAALLTAADAAVDAEATTRADIKALHAEALRANDLWTVVQIEAWANANGLRMRSALPGVTVIGSPLLATPININHVVDLGRHIVTISDRRVYQWRTDGRPLALSRELPFHPWHIAVGFGSAHLAIAAPNNDRRAAAFNLATVALVGVEGGLRQTIDRLPHENLNDLVVADDGSAVAVGTHGWSGPGKAITPRVLFAHGASQSVLAGWQRPLAVGRGGAWLAAQPAVGPPMLVTATAQIPFRLIAAGPGIAVLLREGSCDLVGRDGTLTPLDPPIGLGQQAEVISLGEWLVFSSGPGATTRPTVDLFGNPVAGGKPQAQTCAWLRWSDLLVDPATPAAGREAMDLRIARNHPASLLRLQERQLDLIDLSGPSPNVSPFATAAATVRDVWWHDQQTVLQLAGDAWQVLDIEGREVWSGKAGKLLMQSRRHAVVVDGTGAQQVRSVVSLARDPAQRTQVKLELPAGQWDIRIAREGTPAVATLASDDWCAFSVTTGAVTAKGDSTVRSPQVPWVGSQASFRYLGVNGRLVVTEPPASPTASWRPHDAWRIGRTTTVIGRDGRVYVSNKRGEFVDLGVCAGADHFVRRSGQLLVADSDGRVLAGFAAGPALDALPSGKGELGEPLPAGPWQVDGLDYVPPRSTNLTWSNEHGLVAARLRSPDADSMLVVCSPVVLEVDANAAKLLGRLLGR